MKESEGLYRWFRFVKRTFIGLAAAMVVLGIVGYTLFMRQVDARGAWQAASRELNGGMLHYGERVERFVKAYQRRPSDYYRASNGLLVATNDRLIFIGITPSDKLETEDAPPTILQYEFPNDTLLYLDKRRLYFLTSRGVHIEHGDTLTQEFAASPGSEASMDSLIEHVSRRLTAQKVEAAREVRLRAAVARVISQPIYYVVRRGDAISSIAKRFDATPEDIKKWNNLPSDRVRIGDRLIVKAEGPRPSRPTTPPAAPRPPASRTPATRPAR
ncbi:MAG TPA: LysM peptidoglycan-binding domain-containing protein [Gemmatimonadaceae bacterium]|nr:LysM peptidoglycan-binding domain-containing protein [Gemmatimonadaceae bacterium]